jgi:putative DNA methylase
MLRFTTGDMFETPADIRVNTVNCVGVMGAGVALAFKERYPEMFRDYQKACKAGHVQPGKLHVWKKSAADWVINFPTKRHWREKSRYEDIELGLVALREYLSHQGKVRLNLPALGCGHGGLDWDRVSAMIREKLDGLEADITVFDPSYSKNVTATVSRNGTTTNSLRPNDAAFPTAFSSLGVEQVFYQGDISLLSESAIALAFSPKPTEKELAATLDFITQLARPGLVFSFTMGTAAATQYGLAVLQSGARLAAWVASGLVNYQPSRSVVSLSTANNLLLLSLAPASQRWNPQLARRSALAALLTSRVGLLTDPDPKWLFTLRPNERAALRHPLYYIRYQTTDARLKKRLAEISARAIGKSSVDGKPHIAPILESLAMSSKEPPITAAPEPAMPPVAPIAEPIPIIALDLKPEPITMTSYPKRLIEVDLPIKRISAHARREKYLGTITSLHLWWARRPLAACRAVICAALWPDPVDENCPPAFRKAASKIILDFAGKIIADTKLANEHCSPENYKAWSTLVQKPPAGESFAWLRTSLLDFIADFANWDNSTVREYLATSRALTQAAHEALGGAPGTRPLVVDPFAGGGSIPLEALRVGADAFASDLNPVPVLLNKVVLEYIPKYGQRLADEVHKWGEWIKHEAEKELAEFYPKDADGATPIAYLWARTIQCEGPGCGAEVPLLRSQWLAKKSNHSAALQLVPNPKAKRVDFQIIVKYQDGWADQENKKNRIEKPKFDGTVKRGSATCPCCGYTTPVARVREQLKIRKGAANDSRLMCVVTTRETQQGRFYRLPNPKDFQAFKNAAAKLEELKKLHAGPLSLVPEEPTPLGGGSGAGRAFSQRNYGMDSFADLFTSRQLLVLVSLVKYVKRVGELANKEDPQLAEALQTTLALAVSRESDHLNSGCSWNPSGQKMQHLYARQAIPIVWDFCECNPLGGSVGDWQSTVDCCLSALKAVNFSASPGTVAQLSAQNHSLPNESAQGFMTDPPYYDAIPYSDLSDFFYVWLKRACPYYDGTLLTPKEDECIVDEVKGKDNAFFERVMQMAMAEGRRILVPHGIGLLVFAHKSTSGWEAQLKAMIDAGWIITGSWPIDTELATRLRARDSASLASSVHLVCRPRESLGGSVRSDEVGDWRDVMAELPRRIHEWMPRLAEEGVVGADAIFACLGPALEVFSRYSRVEKANGETVTLKEYLEQIWAAVAKEALALVFKDADTTGFEADARLTAMWLWTLNAGNTNNTNTDATEEDDADDESEDGSKTIKATGFILEYDAARKIAQGLGANLENLSSLVEVSGKTARLLPVGERARTLFGKDEGPVTMARKKKVPQLDLFKVLEQADDGITTFGETKVETHGETVLDRIHQSMILFAAGRSEAMKRFLVEDGAGRDTRFWRLAQALSALYPANTEEKRWVDGVLARKKGLGF